MFIGVWYVCKSQEITQRCGTLQKIQWTLAMIEDFILSGKKDAESDFSLRVLGSKSPPGKGMTYFILRQRALKIFLLNDFLDARAFSPGVWPTSQ